MNWWRRKPSRPTDSDPDLAVIRRDLVWKFGEDIAYAIRLTGKDQTPVGTPTWDPLSCDEALEHIEGLLGERVSLSTPIRVEVQATASGRWIVCVMDKRR